MLVSMHLLFGTEAVFLRMCICHPGIAWIGRMVCFHNVSTSFRAFETSLDNVFERLLQMHPSLIRRRKKQRQAGSSRNIAMESLKCSFGHVRLRPKRSPCQSIHPSSSTWTSFRFQTTKALTHLLLQFPLRANPRDPLVFVIEEDNGIRRASADLRHRFGRLLVQSICGGGVHPSSPSRRRQSLRMLRPSFDNHRAQWLVKSTYQPQDPPTFECNTEYIVTSRDLFSKIQARWRQI